MRSRSRRWALCDCFRFGRPPGTISTAAQSLGIVVATTRVLGAGGEDTHDTMAVESGAPSPFSNSTLLAVLPMGRRPRLKEGGSCAISSDSSSVVAFSAQRSSSMVSCAAGVASNSSRRVRTVMPHTRRTLTISACVRGNPCVRAAIRRAAAHIPAGRRPVWIQSRYMRATTRSAA